jgi:hypothetical protein
LAVAQDANPQIDGRAIQDHDLNGTAQRPLELALELLGLRLERRCGWGRQKDADIDVTVGTILATGE